MIVTDVADPANSRAPTAVTHHRPRAATCTVRDGRFVEPCAALSTEPFELVQSLDHASRQPSRSFVAVWSRGALVPLRACPFCSVEIGGRP